MPTIFLFLATLATLLTAFAHSYFGERRLIGPLVASNDGVMERALAKQVVRLAWHVTTLIWLGQAALLLREALNPQSIDRSLVLGIGLLYIGIGLGDALLTRGKHIGWPLLTAIGVFCILALI